MFLEGKYVYFYIILYVFCFILYVIYYGMFFVEWKLMNLRNNDDEVILIYVVKYKNKVNWFVEIFLFFFIFGLRNFINLIMV